jgi:DNA-binding beta-propeller fold protein YncE
MQSLPLRLTSGQPVKKAADYRLSATVTPVNLASRKAGKAIPVGADPAAVAVTPDGRTVYVANEGSARSPPSTPPPAGRGGR